MNIKVDKFDGWKKYLENFHKIRGWYNHNFNKILLELNQVHLKNDVRGDLMEIGVYQGKSFIPLSLITREDEICLAVDCFLENKTIAENTLDIFNKKKQVYPNPNKEYFTNNLKMVYGEIPEFIKIKESNSNSLFAKDYLEYSKHKKYRIISIDGGHDYRACMWDLMRSFEICCSKGFIIVDDYNDPEWMEVTHATNDFLSINKNIKKYTFFEKRLILCVK